MNATLAQLKELDQLRHDNPKAAIEKLLRHAEEIPHELHPLYLGVCGSTYRLLAGQSRNIEAGLKRADEHIALGLWLAVQDGDDSSAADLLLRRGYVAADRGSYSTALLFAERANAVYDRARARVGRGRALVDQGRYLFHLNRLPDATRSLSAALELLPESEQTNRFSAYQILGMCSVEAGRYRDALEFADRAAQLVPSRAFEGKLRWLQATICLELQDLEKAEEHLLQILEIFRRLHLGEAALAACELVKVQLLRGHFDAAWRTACATREILIPLGDNYPIVAASIGDLLRDGQAALDLKKVAEFRRQLDKARERRSWRSLARP